jgi:hypothetical protein
MGALESFEGFQTGGEAMKRMLCSAVITLVCTLLAARMAAASDGVRQTVDIDLSPDVFAEACAKPVWKGVTAQWDGIRDARESKAVGMQVKGDDEPIEVVSDPPLDAAFDGALRQLFRECGMVVVEKVPDGGLRISAEIEEFFVDVMKNVVSGKSQSGSLLSFRMTSGGKTTDVELGVDMDSKEIRKKKIKALVEGVNKLFAETLKQVSATKQMQEIR